MLQPSLAAPHPPAAGRARRGLLLFLLWTAIGLSFASQFYLSSSLLGRPISWGEALSYALGDWYVWAGLSLVTIYLARRYPIERLRWSDNLARHLIASALTALAYTLLRAAVGQAQSHLVGDPVNYLDILRPLFVKSFHFNLLIYWVILSVAHAANYYRKYHEREKRSIELEKRLAEARLQALQMQLNPHFLFNAMHSISALMHRDVEAADSMLARLSELLRLTLQADTTPLIPLRRELEILERYLDIERVRFGDRLATSVDVPPDTRELLVPCLILQPIVENAIKHGIAPYARPGKIALAARLSPDQSRLSIVISDNGGGLARPIAEGIGLSNTKARLAALYPGNHRFAFEPGQPSGIVVSLEIPATP